MTTNEKGVMLAYAERRVANVAQDRDMWRDSCYSARDERDEAAKRADALAARVAELEAENDARLEFMIEKEVIPHKMGDTGLYMLVGLDHYPYDGSEHDNPREAIDAAILAERDETEK